MNSYTTRYINEARKVVDSLDADIMEEMVDLLRDIRNRQGRLFLLGVGGSAANASHAVNDFRKISRIEAYAPTDNVGELTARINDEGWDTSFIEWLKISHIDEDDAVMVFSVGGGSEHTSVNIVRSLEYSRSVGARILGIVSRDGGFTARVADACIIIPPQSDDTITPLAEAFQAIVWHYLATALAKEE